MSISAEKKRFRWVQGIILATVCVVMLSPFYVALCYAFKTKQDFIKTKLAFPTSFYFGNFARAIQLPEYYSAFLNSLIVAAAVVLLTIITSSTGAYIISRNSRSKVCNVIYYVFQLVIMIPFQSIMFPLYKQLSGIGALNHLWGLILVQVGMYVGYNVFLYAGFVKGIPVSLEEAAAIDGCNQYQVFFKIVFPLLKPIHMTVFVLTFLNSWNDFIMSMIICQKQEMRTLPLMQYYFFGEYSSDVSLAFAASILAMIPTVIVYFVAQKYIVAGMTAGAVKT